MLVRLGIGVAVIAAAFSIAAYAAEQHHNGAHGGGAHGGGQHFGGAGAHFGASRFGAGHGGAFGRGDAHFHGVHGVQHAHGEHGGHEHGHEHGGEHHAHGEHGGHGHGGHGGKHARVAGALRYPLYWLSWPLAYYAAPDLADTCGQDVGDIAGIPVEAYQQVMQSPTDEQRDALNNLASVAAKAAQDIKAACPTEPALTAPGRLAAMQKRLEAMVAAADALQPALDKFYGVLSDEQKARLNLLADGPHPTPDPDAPPGPLAQNCEATQLGATAFPVADIEQAIHPAEAQHAKLVALQNAGTQAAADLLKASCVAETPLTPPARLAAVRKRLGTMLDSVKLVSAALSDFYGTLSDEQKARFEAIGPLLASQDEGAPDGGAQDDDDDTSASDTRTEVTHAPVRRFVPPPIGQFIRHFAPF